MELIDEASAEGVALPRPVHVEHDYALRDGVGLEVRSVVITCRCVAEGASWLEGK